MIRHIVLFNFVEGTPPERIDQVERDLLAYVEPLDGVRSYVIGRNAGLTPTAFEFSVVAEFDDEAAFVAYARGDRHLEIVRELAEIVGERASSQSRLD